MPKIWRVYSGSDGQSHIAEEAPAMKPFTDTEGSYGEAAPTQAASSITFRMSPPGYVLDWHCAPRRQYSISLSGMAEIEADVALTGVELSEVHRLSIDLGRHNTGRVARGAFDFDHIGT